MNDQDQGTKLYHYLDKRFADVHTEMNDHFARVETRLDGIESTVDAIYKRLEDAEIEQTAIQSQLDRHDRWHHQAADKLGLQLDH